MNTNLYYATCWLLSLKGLKCIQNESSRTVTSDQSSACELKTYVINDYKILAIVSVKFIRQFDTLVKSFQLNHSGW